MEKQAVQFDERVRNKASKLLDIIEFISRCAGLSVRWKSTNFLKSVVNLRPPSLAGFQTLRDVDPRAVSISISIKSLLGHLKFLVHFTFNKTQPWHQELMIYAIEHKLTIKTLENLLIKLPISAGVKRIWTSVLVRQWNVGYFSTIHHRTAWTLNMKICEGHDTILNCILL